MKHKADLIPETSRRTLSETLKNTQAWRRWRNANHNDYMQGFLHAQQNGLCEWCEHPLHASDKRPNVHHCTYQHLCTQPSNEPTPDCRRCHWQHPDTFISCTQKLAIVHVQCHSAIHQYQRRQIGSPDDAAARLALEHSWMAYNKRIREEIETHATEAKQTN